MDTKCGFLGVAVAAAVSWGCVLETQVDTDTGVRSRRTLSAADDVASVSQALRATAEFSWTQGSRPTPMGSASDRLCYLTMIRGDFEGNGESVHAYVSSGSWYLGGSSQKAGVSARAACVPLTWNGRSYGYTEAYSWSQGNNPTYLGASLDRTCVLTRVTGDFEGGGERVEAYLSVGGWWLGGSSQQAGVSASARCLTGSYWAGPYGWSQRRDPMVMASTTYYACGLVSMTGRFEGVGEYISVFAAGGSWYVGGASRQADVAARAYCMY